MDNLFNPETYQSIKGRLQLLTETSQPKWGKMTVAQMLQHCNRTFDYALSSEPHPRTFLGLLIGWAVKKQLYDDKPWKQGLPTASRLRVTDSLNFDQEKILLNSTLDAFFTRGPEKVGVFPHPVFGKFTKEQWGMMNYKHLDHHFRQFGV